MDRVALNKQVSRIHYIDIFKGIGIILMIMGHVGFGNVFNKWIHFFHMPMFFIVSGYLYHFQGVKKTVYKRVKSLLVPYLVFGVGHCIISFIINRKFDPHALYLLFWENTAENGIPIAGALWFLTAMFVTEVLFCCLQRIKLSVVKTTTIAAIVAILGMTCATFLPIRLPWAVDAGMVGVGLFQVGKLIKEKIPMILTIKPCYYFGGIMIFSCLGMASPYVNLRLGTYGVWLLFWVNAVGMTISLLGFSKFMNETIGLKYVNFSAWIEGVGRDSIIYLCMNQLTIIVSRNLIKAMIPYSGIAAVIIQKLLTLAVALVMLFLVQRTIMETKLRWILGKA